MKIAVIGNSHIGSLKRGLALMAPAPAHELTFFGARSDGLKDLAIDNGMLVTNDAAVRDAIVFTSGGLDHIAPAQFDAFLLYGMEARPFTLPQDRTYSSAVLSRAVSDVFEDTLSHLTLGKIRSVTDKPIFVGHNPMKGAPRRDTPQDTSALERGTELLNRTVYADMQARFILQPLTTIVNGANSDIAYSQGSRSLAIGDKNDDALHPAIDLNHMNDLFGRLWLEQFFASIDPII